jgi:hypothetical protein
MVVAGVGWWHGVAWGGLDVTCRGLLRVLANPLRRRLHSDILRYAWGANVHQEAGVVPHQLIGVAECEVRAECAE